MPDTPHLRPARPDEIADALSFALRVILADDLMAQIPPGPIGGHSDQPARRDGGGAIWGHHRGPCGQSCRQGRAI